MNIYTFFREQYFAAFAISKFIFSLIKVLIQEKIAYILRSLQEFHALLLIARPPLSPYEELLILSFGALLCYENMIYIDVYVTTSRYIKTLVIIQYNFPHIWLLLASYCICSCQTIFNVCVILSLLRLILSNKTSNVNELKWFIFFTMKITCHS